jgi:alpha-L-rhamnosidase
VLDEHQEWSPWSKPARWTMGLLEPGDWSAQWIGTDLVFERKKGFPPPDNTMPDPWFRKSFTLQERPKRATLYAASVGYHEVYVNGHLVGDAVLEPPVADHRQRARYRTYEIGELLQPGRNVIAFWLGTSWSIFPPYRTADRPQTPLLLAQAHIESPGGGRFKLATDGTWKTHPSPNTLLGVWDFMHFGGELYDARLEVPDWNDPKLNDTEWHFAKVFQPKLRLSAARVEPNRRVKRIRPVAITEATNHVYRIDLGVNCVGWFEMEVKGKPGDRIDFASSERKEEAMTHRLHSAYVIGPAGRGTFRSHFNYQSGRWIEVRGLGYKPSAGDVRAWLVRTDYERATEFECNVPLIQRVYDTALWTFENLSLGGYVVDCPQRERMGYGGDAHATTPMALDNYKMGAFYSKWSEDWRDVQGRAAAWGVEKKAGEAGAGDQLEAGNLPYTAPTYWGGGGPGWCSFCITLPWLVHQQYGDTRILEENYGTIQRWLGFLESKATNNLLRRYGGEWDFLGDWLWPGAEGVNGDTVETLFFNNCIWIYDLQTAARIAESLGKSEDARRWRERANTVRAAVHSRFYNPMEHSYVNGFEAYLALALYVEVPPQELREEVWRRLRTEILVNRQGHIWAGITGGAFLFRTLLAADRNDLLYTMVSKEDYPGWGRMLKEGATTFWEDWEGKLSRLHSSYLYVGAWPVEGLAGIRPDPEAPGFQRFIIRPGICGQPQLTRVRAAYDSIHGRIESAWEVKHQRLHVRVTVPPNTQARVFLPVRDPATVRESGKPLKQAGMKSVRVAGEETELEVRAGRYDFEMPLWR